MTNILREADKIVNGRSEEKERQYGPMKQGMDRAAEMFSNLTGRKFSAREMYLAMIALKLSRESYNPKKDNLLDAVAYIQGLVNHYPEDYA